MGKANSSIIGEIFVFLHDSDIIFSSNGTYSLNTLTQKRHFFADWKKEDLTRDLYTTKPVIKPAGSVTVDNDSQTRLLAILYPIKPNSFNPYGMVMYFIKESVLTDLIQNSLGDFEGNTYIFDEDHQLIASAIRDYDIQQEDLYFAVMKNRGINNVEMEGKEYFLVSVSPEVCGWTFFTLMDTKIPEVRLITLKTANRRSWKEVVGVLIMPPNLE